MKFFRLFLILIAILSTMISGVVFGAGGGCLVDTGPAKGFIEYRKNIDIVLASISSYAVRNRACGKNGLVSQSKRAIDRIDASLNEGFTTFDVITDFRFNFDLLERGEPRNVVKRDGELLRNMENRILNAVATVGTQCALDLIPNREEIFQNTTGTIPPLGTLEYILDRLIQNHKSIESFYKSTTMGSAREVELFYLVGADFVENISTSYHPSMIEQCIPVSGTKSWESVAASSLALIEARGRNTERGLAIWKEALALLNGDAKNQKVRDLEKKILARELKRQGMTGRAADIILSNLAVYHNAGDSEKDSETPNRLSLWVSNISTLLSIGINNSLASTIPASRTTDEWIRRVDNLRAQKAIITPIAAEYSQARMLLSDEAALDTKIITDLMDLHVNLSQTNAELKKAIPKIQYICQERQLPGVGNCTHYSE